MLWIDRVRTNPFLRQLKHADGTTENVEISEIDSNITTTGTPLDATNLNTLVTYKYKLSITSAITGGTAFTIPCYYKVGAGVLDVKWCGNDLLLSSDDAGTDGHYREIGAIGTISNQIKTTTDWFLASGEYLEFVVRGEYSV